MLTPETMLSFFAILLLVFTVIGLASASENIDELGG
jgi:uncharacterized BrkB/YihY/UPF0761 family membrane protein